MKPKLIMLNGAAAVGKTTIADRYAEDNPLTLNFEGDVLIEMISGWRKQESVAREYIFDATKAIIGSYLKNGHDVVVPYLLLVPEHAEAFSKVAQAAAAEFYEVYLEVDKETAVQRLLKRGVWGEANSPRLTESDIPEIEELYDGMVKATAQRPDTIQIPVVEGEIEETYQAFLKVVGR